MERYLLVMAGAAAGGLARYLVGIFISERTGGRFPLGTLVVNVSGCFLIGLLMPLLSPRWRLLLVIGALGGYTTFSSFGWETYQAVRNGSPLIGLLNIVASVVAGYAAVWCGALLASKL